MAFDVTVVILTFNGEEFLVDLLDSLKGQETQYSFEVLVIDSGSKDATIDIVKKYDEVRLIEISNKDFGHGKTRNFAVEQSDSQFVAFLTQDAVPAGPHWLDGLLEPFNLFEKVSCVFGKQIPRPDCVVPVKREVDSVFRSFGDDASISIQRKSEITKRFNIINAFMSDVNSAVRKECVLEVPFRDLNYAEDQALGTDHLNHGWMKAYAPLGSVYHSHSYPLNKFFKRKIDERIGVYEATRDIYEINAKGFIKGVISSTLKDWIFIFRDKHYSKRMKIANFFKSPAYNFALFRCYWLTRKPELHHKHRKHSLEAQTRSKLTQV